MRGCLDPKHYSLATLEEHISQFHLDTISIPCPALGKLFFCCCYLLSYVLAAGCLYTIAASQSQQSHFLAKHLKLLHANHQSQFFKPQWLPLTQQLFLPPPLPANSSFLLYNLIPYVPAIRSHNVPIIKGIDR
jgi:hypothetical protein